MFVLFISILIQFFLDILDLWCIELKSFFLFLFLGLLFVGLGDNSLIINCEPLTFQVSFRQSPSKTISSTYDDKVNFKLPLYIYKIDKNGKFNLEQKNNTNFEESPNDKIFVTPYDINDIKPINNKNYYNFELI